MTKGNKDLQEADYRVLFRSLTESKGFVACMNDYYCLFKELLEIPSGYQVIFSWWRMPVCNSVWFQ